MTSFILRALSRVTSSGKFITEIDGLRFIAIFGVVAFHAHNAFFPANPPVPHVGDGVKPVVSYVLHSGWFGVQLFFIISGFILALPFAQHHLSGAPAVSLGRYLIRRLTRLEPPYLISLAVLAGLQMYVERKSLGLLLPHFAAHAVYLHNAVYGSVDSPGYVAINHVAWSLEVEVQFYLLAPLLTLVFAIRGGRWPRRVVMVGGIIAGIVIEHFWSSPMLLSTLAGQFRWFLIGFLLADIYLSEWGSVPGTGTLGWDVIGTVAWLSVPFILPHAILFEWLMPVVLLGAYMAAFRGRVLNRFFANPWIAVLGGMCYTIYLYHVALIWWVRLFLSTYVTGPERFDVLPWSLLQLLAVCAVAAVACVPLFLIFEKPFMRWKGFRVRGPRSGH
ncbi:MAG TPA: acyltransferase [Vicinamibacterales bacterium]|nr:acyltransferase [Vicinamibacterales bacterium]